MGNTHWKCATMRKIGQKHVRWGCLRSFLTESMSQFQTQKVEKEVRLCLLRWGTNWRPLGCHQGRSWEWRGLLHWCLNWSKSTMTCEYHLQLRFRRRYPRRGWPPTRFARSRLPLLCTLWSWPQFGGRASYSIEEWSTPTSLPSRIYRQAQGSESRLALFEKLLTLETWSVAQCLCLSLEFAKWPHGQHRSSAEK